MTPVTAAETYDLLLARPGLPFTQLRAEIGIYSLWDHTGAIRYIGSTPRSEAGFRGRIGKPIGGSEGRSHKFSQAYCSGRLWRFCPRLHPQAAAAPWNECDAAAAKTLRTRFIRRYCRASCLPMATGHEGLEALEHGVIEIAKRRGPSGMLAWNGTRFPVESEPVALVDALLTETPGVRAAVERQRRLYERYVVDNAK